jgi:hypothetical protein
LARDNLADYKHVFGSARVRIGVSRSAHFHKGDYFLYAKRLFAALADCFVLLSGLYQFPHQENNVEHFVYLF